MNINDNKLVQLIEEIEKVRRRKVVNYEKDDNIQYLDPLNNLGKIKIPNNHLILGRRGSGKTTLLLSTIKEDSRNFILPLDCQTFREWKSEKIILHILHLYKV
jgi:predicted AAA+ superfamily ATPase